MWWHNRDNCDDNNHDDCDEISIKKWPIFAVWLKMSTHWQDRGNYLIARVWYKLQWVDKSILTVCISQSKSAARRNKDFPKRLPKDKSERFGCARNRDFLTDLLIDKTEGLDYSNVTSLPGNEWWRKINVKKNNR